MYNIYIFIYIILIDASAALASIPPRTAPGHYIY